MVTLHPNGFTHGPHPKAFAAGAKAAKTMTDEVAVMIDARDPLDMSASGGSDRRQGLRRQLEPEMKLASLKHGRDGALVVVSRDLTRCVAVPHIAPTLQHAMDHWRDAAPRLMRVYDLLNEGSADGAKPFDPKRLRLAPAARLSMGRRLGLCHPCRAGAQGARRRDAAVLLDRSADVSGRLGRLHRAVRSDPRRRRSLGHRFRSARSRSSPTTCRWASSSRRRREAHQAADAGERRVAAQSDPGRARQEFRLLPVQARQRVFAGRGHAGRTRRGVEATARCICRSRSPSTARASARPMPAWT